LVESAVCLLFRVIGVNFSSSVLLKQAQTAEKDLEIQSRELKRRQNYITVSIIVGIF
jgi:type IV secretory pathway VirD2 relaxase